MCLAKNPGWLDRYLIVLGTNEYGNGEACPEWLGLNCTENQLMILGPGRRMWIELLATTLSRPVDEPGSRWSSFDVLLDHYQDDFEGQITRTLPNKVLLPARSVPSRSTSLFTTA
jgi:hypothetical protein